MALRLIAHAAPTIPLAQRGHAGYWLLSAVLLTMGLLALSVDLALAQWLATHPPRGDVRRFVMLCEAFGFGPTAAVIIVAAGVLDARGRRVAYRLALSAFAAGLAANVVKALVARARPSSGMNFSTVWESFSGWLPIVRMNDWSHATQSFPSAHAATAVGLALGLAAAYPRGRWLFAVLAALAGFQRVLAGAHHLSDVLIGAAVAVAVYAALDHWLHRSGRLRWAVDSHE